MKRDLWNKCQVCGKIIPYADFADGRAINRLLEPSSDLGVEKWETLEAIKAGTWKAVPVEPTILMDDAGEDAHTVTRKQRLGYEGCCYSSNVYRAMLAAAPKKPEG